MMDNRIRIPGVKPKPPSRTRRSDYRNTDESKSKGSTFSLWKRCTRRPDSGSPDLVVLLIVEDARGSLRFCSFAFNLGAAALQRSTLRRKVNREEHDAVPRKFRRWVWAGGRRLKGLVRRREAETELYASQPVGRRPDRTQISLNRRPAFRYVAE